MNRLGLLFPKIGTHASGMLRARRVRTKGSRALCARER